MMVQDLLF